MEVAPTAQSSTRDEDNTQSDDPVSPEAKYDTPMPTLEFVSTSHAPAQLEDDAQSDESSPLWDSVGAKTPPTILKGSSSAALERFPGALVDGHKLTLKPAFLEVASPAQSLPTITHPQHTVSTTWGRDRKSSRKTFGEKKSIVQEALDLERR